MGYNGQVSQERRQLNHQIDECYRIVRIGLEMCQVVKEEKLLYPNNKVLQDLQLRVGIHTGSILGGLIGSQLIRYDIFGPDVKISKEMKSNGVPWKTVISNATKDLLQKHKTISDRFSFEFHKT